MVMSTEQKLGTARLMVTEKEPYFTTAILSLIPRAMPGLGTLAVDDSMNLYYDPETVNNAWTIPELAAVLSHEVEHVLRDHMGRCKRLGIIPESGTVDVNDPNAAQTMTLSKIANWAEDAEINDDKIAAGWKLPGDPITPTSLREVATSMGKTVAEAAALFPENTIWEVYYQSLKRLKEEHGEEDLNNAMAGTNGNEDDSEEDEDGNKKNKPRTGQGQCGRCAGRPVHQEPQPEGSSGSNKDKQQQQKPQKPGDGDGDGSGDGQPGSGGGGSTSDEVQGRSEAEIESIRRSTAEQVRQQGERGRGNVPGGLLRWAEDKLGPAQIRWQDKLARCVRGSIAELEGNTDYWYQRCSRQQGALGFGEGVPILPAMFSPKPKVAVGVDTSGSMGTEDLETALRETQGVIKAVGGDIRFLACDAAVHSNKKVKNIKEVMGLMKGGGGTSFKPIFKAVEDLKPRDKPDVFIFITDGGGDAPMLPPKGIKVIWVLCGRHRCMPHKGSWGGGEVDWGTFVEVKDLR
jgi:predicted metal-dependent peptidase